MNAKWSLFTLVLVLCLVVAGFAVASSRGVKKSGEDVELTTPELPREWVWKKKAVTFDDMVRKR
jgi:hypothetical protein